ncbi:HIT family protein [Parvularcula sp. LCG005]|uniref:HIT family protein n=1 Tax=Parvularcula sp. LCG005 TaxID=3078805 RepID=UPI002942B6A8|nr:HIT family protein [Parvularcula sp. LCG005]WOI52373.1 HIT family protein [Parvularcula sp. LCG005]
MSLQTRYDSDNVFAKIIRGEIPAVKILEDDEVLVLMDAFPQTKGHALVISRTAHAVNLLDVPPAALTRMILAAKEVADAIVRALKPDGFRIVQYNGAPAGQSVFHLHFHIIPVWEGEAVGSHAHKMADPADLEDTAKAIREQL